MHNVTTVEVLLTSDLSHLDDGVDKGDQHPLRLSQLREEGRDFTGLDVILRSVKVGPVRRVRFEVLSFVLHTALGTDADTTTSGRQLHPEPTLVAASTKLHGLSMQRGLEVVYQGPLLLG
ncbi:hypothetical protein N7465_005529 [Penicillium sp. CMV-2018d]|nr:hypothetical protein N7465_005529 [Penicillium sp. CMV-2018d]